MTLNKLAFRPDEEGYAVAFPTGLLSVQLDGGAPRERRDVIGNWVTVQVSWSCPMPQDYAYLRQAHRYCEENGGSHFLIDLIMEDGMVTECEAKFVPGTFKLESVKGLQRVVSAQLQIMPTPGLDNTWPEPTDDMASLLLDDGGHLLI